MRLRPVVILLAALPLLWGTTCEQDPPTYDYPKFKVRVSDADEIYIGDTIWLRGSVSSQVFVNPPGDSSRATIRTGPLLTTRELVSGYNDHNAIGGIQHFDLIHRGGHLSIGDPQCSDLFAQCEPMLGVSQERFVFTIGFIPTKGVISYFIWPMPI